MEVPKLTAERLTEIEKGAFGLEELLRIACTPSADTPPGQAAAFFITRYCKTIDEDNPGVVAPIPPWPFVLSFIEMLERNRLEGMNGYVDKSRRMLATWMSCAYVLWRMHFTPGFPAFLTSGRGQDYVDDGGENSTPRSLFGRLRFMHDRLPQFLRKHILFAFKRAVCVETDAYVTGEAPTEQGGRGTGVTMALVDEAAFLPYSESFHRALDPACRNGRLYVTTPNGPANICARILKTKPVGWRIHRLDWTEHPLLSVGLGPTPEHELDRFGSVVSPRFREITSTLRDDDIQQEYNHSIERSMKGLVYKEFNLRKHVLDSPIIYDPELPIIAGVDYGATGYGAAVFGQLVGPWSLRIIADYELEGAGGAKEHAANEAEILRYQGFSGDLSEVQLVGGPDTDTTQTGSGQTIGGYYRAAGFTRIRQSRVRGPGSVDRGITVVCTSLRQDRILISPTCVNLIGRFGEYRWPVERGTGIVRATAPVHNEASHIMDAFRYLVTEAFPNETVDSGFGARRIGLTAQPHEWATDVPPRFDRASTIVGARREY